MNTRSSRWCWLAALHKSWNDTCGYCLCLFRSFIPSSCCSCPHRFSFAGHTPICSSSLNFILTFLDSACPSICLSLFDSSSGRRVCCWAPCGWEILIDCCWHWCHVPAAGTLSTNGAMARHSVARVSSVMLTVEGWGWTKTCVLMC